MPCYNINRPLFQNALTLIICFLFFVLFFTFVDRSGLFKKDKSCYLRDLTSLILSVVSFVFDNYSVLLELHVMKYELMKFRKFVFVRILCDIFVGYILYSYNFYSFRCWFPYFTNFVFIVILLKWIFENISLS